jgi:protein-L-isoaspartate(D-aspartate) O-methyltransferase
MAAPRAEDRALVLGAGTGYGAAVLAAMGTRVTAVEPEPALRAIAEAGFAAAGLWAGAVRLVAASPREGLAEAGPHDVILIEGAIPAVPEVIAGQLAEAGRLATVVAETAGTGRGVLGRRIGGAFTLLPVFDCATAALPAFAREPGFVF